jgi:aspartate-semialdehyde dehydrogenase
MLQKRARSQLKMMQVERVGMYCKPNCQLSLCVAAVKGLQDTYITYTMQQNAVLTCHGGSASEAW